MGWSSLICGSLRRNYATDEAEIAERKRSVEGSLDAFVGKVWSRVVEAGGGTASMRQPVVSFDSPREFLSHISDDMQTILNGRRIRYSSHELRESEIEKEGLRSTLASFAKYDSQANIVRLMSTNISDLAARLKKQSVPYVQMILIHELAHAVQHQSSTQSANFSSGPADRFIARECLCEGHALIVQDAVAKEIGIDEDILANFEMDMGFTSPLGHDRASHDEVERELLEVTQLSHLRRSIYYYGKAYALAVGAKATLEAIKNPQLATWEIVKRGTDNNIIEAPIMAPRGPVFSQEFQSALDLVTDADLLDLAKLSTGTLMPLIPAAAVPGGNGSGLVAIRQNVDHGYICGSAALERYDSMTRAVFLESIQNYQKTIAQISDIPIPQQLSISLIRLWNKDENNVESFIGLKERAVTKLTDELSHNAAFVTQDLSLPISDGMARIQLSIESSGHESPYEFPRSMIVDATYVVPLKRLGVAIEISHQYRFNSKVDSDADYSYLRDNQESVVDAFAREYLLHEVRNSSNRAEQLMPIIQKIGGVIS
eukprot:Clim_evm4s196 gene=Clim_evmTU4s196